MNDATPSSPIFSPGKRRRRFLSWLVVFLVASAAFVYFTRAFWVTTLRAYYIGRAYIAGEQYGRFLPDVDEIEILALGGAAAAGDADSFPPDIGPRLGTVNRHTVRGDEANSIARIWRDMYFDRHFSAICHQPFTPFVFATTARSC